VASADSPIYKTAVQIPPGAIKKRCTFNIGAVTNPPALPRRTRAVGRVIEFGPSGWTFAQPLTITLPYTAAALKQARVTDTAELEVFYYDTALLAWVAVQVDSIDPVNRTVSIQTNHFSMYTIAAAVADSSSSGGGGGAGCFVSTAQASFFSTELAISSMLGLLVLVGLFVDEKERRGKVKG
jgi:hypothetical protein